MALKQTPSAAVMSPTESHPKALMGEFEASRFFSKPAVTCEGRSWLRVEDSQSNLETYHWSAGQHFRASV